MPRDKTVNHSKIMAAAKEEFMEKGFEKASMRSIADRCGMTAAGIYRHCKDKEDLFCQIVSSAEKKLRAWAKDHMQRYEERIQNGSKIIWQDSFIELVKEIVYPNMEDYHLLIEKSKGSKYESFLHDMTEEAQSKISFHFEEMKAAGYNITDISERQLHLLMTAYITALFEPVVHRYSYEEAIDTLSTLEKFFLPGWKQLMGI